MNEILRKWIRASPVVQSVNNLPAMWETWVQSLGQEDPLEEGMATHTSILAWRIPMDRGAWEGYNPRCRKESGTTRRLSTKHLPWSRVVKCKIHLPITTLLSHPLPQRLWAWPCELLWPVRHQQTCSKQRLSEVPAPGTCPLFALKILRASQAMNQREPAGR